MKPYIQYKSFSNAEESQLSNLSFVAGGHLRKSASNRRNSLRDKQMKIYETNFIIKLKNFCIDLHNGIFDYSTFMDVSGHLNLHKKPVDEMDYSIIYLGLPHRATILQQFIQRNLPFSYTKMYYHGRSLIQEQVKPTEQQKETSKPNQLNLF